MICSSANRLFFIFRPSLGGGRYFRLEEFCRGRSNDHAVAAPPFEVHTFPLDVLWMPEADATATT